MGETPGGTLPLEKGRVPPGPPPKETILGRIRRPMGASGAALLRLRKSVSVPARPPRAGTGNQKRLSWERAREGAFFQKKESPSPKTPFPRKPLCRVRPSKGGAGGVRYFAVSRIISLNAPDGAFKSGGAGGTASCRGLGRSPNVPLAPFSKPAAFLHSLPLERAAWRVQKRRCRRHCLLPGLGAEPQRSLVPFVLLVPYRLSSLSRVWIAFFSMRETYEREMPSFSATSYWGRHSPSSRP